MRRATALGCWRIGWYFQPSLLSIRQSAEKSEGDGREGRTPAVFLVLSFHPVRSVLAIACVCATWPSAAWADDPRIDELARQLRDVQQQLNALKAAVPRTGEVVALLRSTTAQISDLHKRMDAETRVSMPNGRLIAVSSDGAFSLALRATVQFDAGYFAHDRMVVCPADRERPRRA